jgi:hypothetical protein
MYSNCHNAERLRPMQSGNDDKVKSVLVAEIGALQKYYATIKGYLSGKTSDPVDVAATVLLFKDGLNRISSHILTLYVLNKQKTKITWEQLLANLENASSTLESPTRNNIKAAIELAFDMSEPNAEEVMAYLAKLKESLML